MKNDKFIPISVIEENGFEKIWYMDISNLGLEDLLNLRENLKGTIKSSVIRIDTIVNNYFITDNGYNGLENTFKRTERRKKARIRDLSNKRHRR